MVPKLVLEIREKMAIFSGEFGTSLSRVNYPVDLTRSTSPAASAASSDWRRSCFLIAKIKWPHCIQDNLGPDHGSLDGSTVGTATRWARWRARVVRSIQYRVASG